MDHIIKSLLASQLVRITGRSEMPGRPFQYGTTQAFLEHFGLKNLKDLGDMGPFLAALKEQSAKQQAGVKAPGANEAAQENADVTEENHDRLLS